MLWNFNAFLDFENISAAQFKSIFPKPTVNFLSVLISQNILAAVFPNKHLVVVCLVQGLQTFLSGDHIRYYTTVRGQDILRNVIVSGYIAFHQINKFFVNIVCFSLVTKCFRGSDETTSRAGFGSWRVVRRPWFRALKCSVKSLKNMRGWQTRVYQQPVDIPAFFIHKQPNFI